MNRPIDRSSDKDEVLRYAPKWARDVEEAFRQSASQSAPPADTADGSVPTVPIGSPGSEHYPSLAPTIVPEPPPPESLPWQRGRVEVSMRSGVSAARWFPYFFAIVFAAATALVTVVQWPVLQRAHENESADAKSFASRFGIVSHAPSSATQDPTTKSKLIETARPLVAPTPVEVASAKPEPHIETVPFGRVGEVTPAPAGPAQGVQAWARQNAPSVPVEVALAKPDQPTGTGMPDAKSPRVTEEKAAPAEAGKPARPLSADEIETLLEQGRNFVSVGDFVSARTLFGRIAEARDARGALALAETYDPIVIARNGMRGITPDVKKAREWYAKAQDLGSPDAAPRLGALAQNAR